MIAVSNLQELDRGPSTSREVEGEGKREEREKEEGRRKKREEKREERRKK